MTYIFRVSEDFEHDNDFMIWLDCWLQNEVGSAEYNLEGAHYGFTLFAGTEYNKRWEKLLGLYEEQYKKLFEDHFGTLIPIHAIAEFERAYCDYWTIFRIRFCYDADQDTPMNDHYFYAVDVADDEHDTNMIRFQLTQM